MKWFLKLLILMTTLLLSIIGGAIDGAIIGYKAWSRAADILGGLNKNGKKDNESV